MTGVFFAGVPYALLFLCLITGIFALALSFGGGVIDATNYKNTLLQDTMDKRAKKDTRMSILFMFVAVLMAFWAGAML